MGMNYGLDKIRFIAPVPAGSKSAPVQIAGVTRKAEPGRGALRRQHRIEGGRSQCLPRNGLTIAFFGES